MTDLVAVAVCDAGPLIHLDELGCLSLLNDFQQILVPEQVLHEIKIHRPNFPEQSEISFEGIDVLISSAPSFQGLVRTFSLDFGEQAALSLMQEFPRAIFLTDDAAARLAANTMGLRVHGTVGILLRAVRRKQRSRGEILAIFERLPEQSSLYIKKSLLEEVIQSLRG